MKKGLQKVIAGELIFEATTLLFSNNVSAEKEIIANQSN